MILDCTIRDGSYATGNRWDKEALHMIVEQLSAQSIQYIEIGNGTGLGTYRKNSSAMSDEDYFASTLPYKGNSKIGAFFIPTVGTREDLKNFREKGGDFIRIGANATEIETTFEYIRYAKELGFFVCCNVMKTYAITKFQLVEIALKARDNGADCIYIVDSAGGMLPEQIKQYVEAIQAFSDIKVGFHGHNNLLMANANSLAALQAGAYFADATLLGIGRGAGNAQLESLVAVCKKARMDMGQCNALQIADLAQQVLGFMNLKGSTKREINVGLQNFHDSYAPILERVAIKYAINPEILMEEVCKINIIDPSEELFEFAASTIKEGRKVTFIPNYSHHQF